MAWRNYTSSNRPAHQESFKAPALRPGFFIACPAILPRSSRNLTSIDDVNEYNLSTAWDISTASFSQLFDSSGAMLPG